MSGAVLYLPRAASTNAWAKAHPDCRAGTWAVYTLDQTAGRGRLGRTWADAAGLALYYTAVLPFAPVRLETLPLLAGLLVCEALRERCAPRGRLAVKWPNDVLLNGKKLAGILCEAVPGQQKTVCGIGINLAQSAAFFAAAGLPHATSLAAEGIAADAARDAGALAETLTAAFARAVPVLAEQGFAPWLAAYRRACINLGRHVLWDGGEGTALDVDEEGRLLVAEDGSGVKRLFTGEVRVRGIYEAAAAE